MRNLLSHPRKALATIAAVLVLVTSVTALVSMKRNEDPIYYVDFANASPLIVGNDVKVAGVSVGKVDSIEVVNGQARVGMALNREALPIHTDARAVIEPASLLGERYVQLARGSADAPTMKEGAVLSTKNSSNSVDLDQVLNAVDAPTSQALAAFLTTVGNGLNGRGPKVAAAIKALQPAMTDTRALADVLNQQSNVLTQLITNLEPLTTAAASDNGADLDRLLGATDRVLKATSERQKDLDSTLAQLPGALKQGTTTLALLSRTANATTPMLAGMRPTTDVLTQLAQELSAFSDAGQPALKALQPTLERARTFLAAAAPVAASLNKSSPALARTAKGIEPVAMTLLKDLHNVLDFVKFWALTTNNADGLSNYFRSLQVASVDPVTGLLPGGTPPLLNGLVNGTKGGNPLGGLGDTLDGLLGGLTGNKPKSGSTASNQGGLLGGLLGGLGMRTAAPQSSQRTAPKASVTGLTEKQETAMVEYLVGGSR